MARALRFAGGSTTRSLSLWGGHQGRLPRYWNFIRTLSECSHIGHSKERRCSPGASDSMRASIIWVPHSGHSGHTIRVVGRGGVSTGNPLISAALEKISHRTGKETVQYCSHAAPRDTRQWQRHAQCRANSYPCPSSARQFDCGARSEAASRHRG